MVKNKKNTVFVAMSGGVDSSVAALLLKKQDYQIVGVFIRGFSIDGCGERDATDARRVAGHLKIPFYVFDFEKEYKEKVVEYMVETYKKGLTPNPDVMCNKEIKFGMFLEKAMEMGANYVATGHYVRLSANNEFFTNKRINEFPIRKFVNSQHIRYSLMMAKDKNKDQSYFLWTLTQGQLRRCLFPIGGYLKPEVRKIAKKAGLPTADKKDSQGICFLGKITLKDFLKQYLPTKKGAVLLALNNVEGTTYKKIGEHDGAWFYTIGQRHLKISNIKNQISNSLPLYVAEKDIKTNILVVAEENNNAALYKKEIEIVDVNFINPITSSLIRANCRIEILTRVRYRQPLVSAALKIENLKLKIEFDVPVKSVAPGQSAVFYSKKNELIGGGIIKSAK